MARTGDVLEVPALGVSVEFRRTTEDTGGEFVEFDLVGRPKGFITIQHVHPRQSERHEVIEGSLRVQTRNLERILGPGDVVETPAGTPHRHRSAGGGTDDRPTRVRVQVRPALAFEAWIERIAGIDFLPGGWPRPADGARLLLDFEGEAHGTVPPLALQQAAARAVLKATQSRR